MAKTAKIAEFKSRLSAYLKDVRGGGEVVILDRFTPIARVLPVIQAPTLPVHPPKIAGGFKNYRFQTVPVDVDVVAMLRTSRKDK